MAASAIDPSNILRFMYFPGRLRFEIDQFYLTPQSKLAGGCNSLLAPAAPIEALKSTAARPGYVFPK